MRPYIVEKTIMKGANPCHMVPKHTLNDMGFSPQLLAGDWGGETA